eukprot:5221245-Pleurochrysis_carterae.AAC.1
MQERASCEAVIETSLCHGPRLRVPREETRVASPHEDGCFLVRSAQLSQFDKSECRLCNLGGARLTSRRIPLAPVDLARSDPARSTRFSLALRRADSERPQHGVFTAIETEVRTPPSHRYSQLSATAYQRNCHRRHLAHNQLPFILRSTAFAAARLIRSSPGLGQMR